MTRRPQEPFGAVRLLVAIVALALPAAAAADQGSLTLRQAVGEALRASPALREPEDSRAIAEIRQRQAAASFGVKLTPAFQTGTDPAGLNARSMGVTLSKRLPTGTALQVNATSFEFGTAANHIRDSGYTVGISQPLLRGWTSVASAGIDQARRQAASAERRYADASQALVISVAGAYYTVVRAQRLVDAARSALDRASQLRTSSEARSKVGLATELDVLRADLLTAQSEAAVASQQEMLEASADALKTLIGRPADRDLRLADTEVIAVDEPPTESVEQLTAMALANRIDVREARDQIGDARRTASVAKWELLPPVNLEASYTRRGLGVARPYAFQPLFGGWHVGLSTSYGLDRSDAQAGAALAAISVVAAERDAEDTARRAADEVRQAYRAWTRSLTTMEIQSKALVLAERQLRLAQIRYERGIAGNFDVIDAENNLIQAQSGLIGAQVERALAGLTLRRVAGTLNVQRFLP
jgi:outer membrane protein